MQHPVGVAARRLFVDPLMDALDLVVHHSPSEPTMRFPGSGNPRAEPTSRASTGSWPRLRFALRAAERGTLSPRGTARVGKSFARPPRKRSLPAERIAKSWSSRASRGYQDTRTVTANREAEGESTAAEYRSASRTRLLPKAPGPGGASPLGIGLRNEARASATMLSSQRPSSSAGHVASLPSTQRRYSTCSDETRRPLFSGLRIRVRATGASSEPS